MASVVKIFLNILLLLYLWLKSLALIFVPKRLRYKSISGEIVLITGGGSGIGRQLATRFADYGAKIVVWDLNLELACETVKLITDKGGKAFPFQCDVSNRQNVYDTADDVNKEIGKVTILVNNAGIVTGKVFLECPDHMIQKTFEVNAMAHFWTCKAFLPAMLEDNHGHIVAISSMGGLGGVPRLTDYCASKHAVVGLEEALRLELNIEGFTGIHSTVVCPNLVDTGMFAGAKSGILPMMSPKYVANEIVSAVLVNQEVLLLPKILMSTVIILKSIIPPTVLRVLISLFDFENPMVELKGRTNVA